MATLRKPAKDEAKDILLLCLGWLCVLGVIGWCCWFMYSCAAENHHAYEVEEEAKRIQAEHADDKSVNPATLAPYRSLPYVIANDDLCKITITGKPILSDEFITGYERLRSYQGDVFELTIENKSDKLTIRAGTGGEWKATGRYSSGDEMNSGHDMDCSYNGFINLIEPSKEHSGDFSVFTKEHGSLDYVNALRGWFEICDDDGKMLALYPFSYEEFDTPTARKLPATFVDDETCRFAITELSWDGGRERWVWSYEFENRTDGKAHLECPSGCHVAGAHGDAFASFDDGTSKAGSSAKPDGDTIKGKIMFDQVNEKNGTRKPVATDEDEFPGNMYGTLALVLDGTGNDGKRVLAYIPFATSLDASDY